MTNTVKTNTVSHGTVGATPVSSNVDSGGLASKRYVTLSANYARLIPAGYPDPNAGMGAQVSHTAYPKTILSGARVQFFAHEAAAIVAASGGAYS